ncbi:MAG: hypothetical protein CMN06_09110 [Roseibacillus sp.]|nr:hypothetical protein [Roseibacillus sp.]
MVFVVAFFAAFLAAFLAVFFTAFFAVFFTAFLAAFFAAFFADPLLLAEDFFRAIFDLICSRLRLKYCFRRRRF